MTNGYASPVDGVLLLSLVVFVLPDTFDFSGLLVLSAAELSVFSGFDVSDGSLFFFVSVTKILISISPSEKISLSVFSPCLQIRLKVLLCRFQV